MFKFTIFFFAVLMAVALATPIADPAPAAEAKAAANAKPDPLVVSGYTAYSAPIVSTYAAAVPAAHVAYSGYVAPAFLG